MELIRGTALSGYRALAADLGADPDEILRSTGIGPEDTEAVDAFISLRSGVRALEIAAVVTATPDFGRRLALRQDIGILGPLAVAARTAPTVADVFAVFNEFVASYSRGLSITMPAQPDPSWSFLQWELHLDPLPPHSQAMELSLGVMLGVLRTFLGKHYSPASVDIPHQMLTPASAYRRYYGCGVRDMAQAAGFLIESADLARPLDQDLLTHRTAIGYLSNTAAGDGAGSVVRSVTAAVRPLLPSAAVTIDAVARSFGMHPKALQRKLAAEGTNFAAVVDRVRRDAAERYLRDTDITLRHLSHELGYAEQSVLTRACQRWFGKPPLAYRAALRERRM